MKGTKESFIKGNRLFINLNELESFEYFSQQEDKVVKFKLKSQSYYIFRFKNIETVEAIINEFHNKINEFNLKILPITDIINKVIERVNHDEGWG